jgi:hypothetical protein
MAWGAVWANNMGVLNKGRGRKGFIQPVFTMPLLE